MELVVFKSAYEFVDWLKGAGQSYWQILPLGPTSYGDSPYQSFSTFAGNPYFISLDELIEEGVLTRAECEKVNWGKQRVPLITRRFIMDAILYFAKLMREVRSVRIRSIRNS